MASSPRNQSSSRKGLSSTRGRTTHGTYTRPIMTHGTPACRTMNNLTIEHSSPLLFCKTIRLRYVHAQCTVLYLINTFHMLRNNYTNMIHAFLAPFSTPPSLQLYCQVSLKEPQFLQKTTIADSPTAQCYVLRYNVYAVHVRRRERQLAPNLTPC